MGPGLVRMLDMISANSNDSMLVDRFLILASDMPEHEKVEATLRLARTLLKKSPRKAIEIAWMVYNSSLRDAESLSLIADAFDGLGKQGKGELIRSELKRITNGHLSPEVRNLARLTVEEHVTTTLAGKELSPPIDVAEVEPLPLMTLDMGSHVLPVEAKVDVIQPKKIVSTHIVDQHSTIVPSKFDLDLSAPATASQQFSELAKDVQIVSTKDESATPVSARLSAALPSAGIPEAIPPKEPSRHSISSKYFEEKKGSQAATQASVATSKFNQSHKNPSVEDQLTRLEELVNAGSWERLISLLHSSFPAADHPYLLSYFERHQLHRIDISYAEFWLDVLIAARQERRALRFIISRLTEEPHLAWARMVLPKVQKITATMELAPIEWRESDGVLALRDRIARQRPRVGCYWAA